jgi:hypothetical protein
MAHSQPFPFCCDLLQSSPRSNAQHAAQHAVEHAFSRIFTPTAIRMLAWHINEDEENVTQAVVTSFRLIFQQMEVRAIDKPTVWPTMREEDLQAMLYAPLDYFRGGSKTRSIQPMADGFWSQLTSVNRKLLLTETFLASGLKTKTSVTLICDMTLCFGIACRTPKASSAKLAVNPGLALAPKSTLTPVETPLSQTELAGIR